MAGIITATKLARITDVSPGIRESRITDENTGVQELRIGDVESGLMKLQQMVPIITNGSKPTSFGMVTRVTPDGDIFMTISISIIGREKKEKEEGASTADSTESKDYIRV